MERENSQAKGMPLAVRLVWWLFMLIAAIWFGFGVYSLIHLQFLNSSSTPIGWIVAFFMFANGSLFLWAGWGLKQTRKNFLYFAVALLGVNILLSLTDEFGFFDLATMILDIGLLGLLLATRSSFLEN